MDHDTVDKEIEITTFAQWKKYPTNRLMSAFVSGLVVVGYVGAVFGSPHELRIDAFVIGVPILIVLLFFGMKNGTFITLSDGILSEVDSFVFRKELNVNDIEIIRYQPTYGVGKEASSLYIFSKEESVAVITMTNIWFPEKTLSDLVKDLRAANPTIRLDEEARELMERF